MAAWMETLLGVASLLVIGVTCVIAGIVIAELWWALMRMLP